PAANGRGSARRSRRAGADRRSASCRSARCSSVSRRSCRPGRASGSRRSRSCCSAARSRSTHSGCTATRRRGARNSGKPAVIRAGVLRAASLVAAVVGLDLALTFAHVWPTFAIRPTAALSIEILAVVTGILLLGALGRPPGKRVATALALLLTSMVAARYAAVTTAGLYGRPVHLYFDLPHVPNVFAMLAKVASPWLLAAGALAAAAIVAAVLVGLRAALVRVATAAGRPRERAAVAAACVAAGALGAAGTWTPLGARFAEPVTGMALAQAAGFVEARSASRRDALLPPPAAFGDGPLGAPDGRDVPVVLIESYGAVAFDR